MFSSLAKMLRVEGPRFFLCVGCWSPGGGIGGVALPREGTRPLTLGRQELWMALCVGIIPQPQPCGELKGLPLHVSR